MRHTHILSVVLLGLLVLTTGCQSKPTVTYAPTLGYCGTTGGGFHHPKYAQLCPVIESSTDEAEFRPGLDSGGVEGYTPTWCERTTLRARKVELEERMDAPSYKWVVDEVISTERVAAGTTFELPLESWWTVSGPRFEALRHCEGNAHCAEVDRLRAASSPATLVYECPAEGHPVLSAVRTAP